MVHKYLSFAWLVFGGIFWTCGVCVRRDAHILSELYICIYRVIQNDCRGVNNLSYTIHLRWEYRWIKKFSKFSFMMCGVQ